MRILILSFCLLTFTSIASAASLSRADKQGFFESFLLSCTSNMQKTSTMTSGQIRQWCGCVGVEYANILNKEELRTGQVVTQKMNAANKICEKKLLTPSGLFK